MELEFLGTEREGTGGPDVVLLVPPEEFPPAPALTPNARRPRLELPEVPPELAPSTEYSKLLVRTALIRSDRYSPGMRRPMLRSNDDTLRLLGHVAAYDQEHVIVLATDSKGKLAAIHESSIGTTSTSLVQARHVLKVALLVGATGAVVVHNHPSGDPTPSPEDAVVTAMLEASGGVIGVNLLDHLVIADEGLTSFMVKRTYLRGGGSRPLPPEILSLLESERQRFSVLDAPFRAR